MTYKLLSIGFLVLRALAALGQTELSDSLWKMGIQYSWAEDYLRALEYEEAYAKLRPGNGKIYNNLAIGKFYLGDEEGGCADLQLAKDLGVNRNQGLYRRFCDKEAARKMLADHDYRGIEIYPEKGYRPHYTREDTLRGALLPERACYDVYFYDLTVRIKPLSKTIAGINKIYFTATRESRVLQVDLFSLYQISGIVLDGDTLNYTRSYNAILIDLPAKLVPGKTYILSIGYEGKPARAKDPPWDGGIVWSRDRRLNHWVGMACEHLGASSWWPNKDHLSDRPDSMAIHLEVPGNYQGIANGSFQGAEELEDRYTRYNWFVNYPINNYNVTFYMGKYARFTDTLSCCGDTLMALYHVLPYNLDKAVPHFKQAREIIGYYCQAFGPFPFTEDNFRMVESPYAGMEHQTAIAYGNAYSNARNALGYLNKDFDYIIVHEAAHEWWGNSLGAADMADIWLHEGFATHAEYLFLENREGYDVAMKEMANHWRYIFNLWPLVQNRDVNENTFASGDVYGKGSALLQCLRATMDNDSLFMNLIRDFHLTYRDTTLQSRDFIDFVNAYTQHDYSALFEVYLYHTKLPVLQYTYERMGDDLVLRYRWTGVMESFEMPFSIRVIGKEISYRIMADSNEQELILKDCPSFSFYNEMQSLEGLPHNGLTYFRTKCLNFE